MKHHQMVWKKYTTALSDEPVESTSRWLYQRTAEWLDAKRKFFKGKSKFRNKTIWEASSLDHYVEYSPDLAAYHSPAEVDVMVAGLSAYDPSSLRDIAGRLGNLMWDLVVPECEIGCVRCGGYPYRVLGSSDGSRLVLCCEVCGDVRTVYGEPDKDSGRVYPVSLDVIARFGFDLTAESFATRRSR